jgi:bifunctional enzyme CysN/CysC
MSDSSAESSPMLRFITCGSVDDGKSTLIGRLLYDSHLVLADHLAALTEDSRKVGTQGGELDFALLLDGLSAEREQGITIDVAYRFFATETRKFIVADTPGHEQYTRNMVTGASTADVAVILIDARKGVLKQTRRHSYLVSLLGIRKIVLAINKMDLVEFSESRFNEIVYQYRTFADQIGLKVVTPIPLSALRGDNVANRSTKMGWYSGPTLMEFLDHVSVEPPAAGPFRFPIQWVNRPNLDFRGFSGTLLGGAVAVGDRVRVMPSGVETTVAGIVTADGDLVVADLGQAVTITLTDEVDASRGDVLAAADAPPEVADQFEAHVVWMHETPLLSGRSYLMKVGARSVGMMVSQIKYKVNVNTLEHLAAPTLELNEIGVCNISVDRPIAFDPYTDNRDMGSFIIIDRLTNATVGAGLLHFALRRSQNIQWQAVEVDRAARRKLNGHGSGVVWFTGLSGSGKSTIAALTEKQLHGIGIHTYLLDGDNIRHGLNKDLGFTDADRVENIRRVAEVARLMADAGQVVLVSFISPFANERASARALMAPGEFCEVFVDTPLSVAEERDPKGLYKKARAGQLPHFTGIDSPYEAPTNSELVIETVRVTPEEAAALVIARIRLMGLL